MHQRVTISTRQPVCRRTSGSQRVSRWGINRRSTSPSVTKIRDGLGQWDDIALVKISLPPAVQIRVTYPAG
jgi:hypothetical protein